MPPLLDGLAVDVAVPVPPCNAAWHSAAKLHCAPPPSRLRGRLSANGPASELALRRRQRDRMCSSFPTCRRRKHRRVSGLRRGAVTRDVRASVPQSPPPSFRILTLGHCIQIEPVRPPRRNGCTTLHRQRSLPAGRTEAGDARVRRGARGCRPANGNRESPATGLVKPQLRASGRAGNRDAPPKSRRSPQGVDPWSSAGSLLICAVRKQWGTAWGWGPGSRGSPSPSTRPPPLFTGDRHRSFGRSASPCGVVPLLVGCPPDREGGVTNPPGDFRSPRPRRLSLVVAAASE